ncbi:MAG: Ig-like domain-containing protein [Gemmatimonadetes bacterium]|nr:Ig-like domain-containing protein [Gemmatimonadota bacterium]
MPAIYRHRTSGALRLALSVSVPVAVVAWVVGCGEPRSPVAVGSIPELTVEVGSTESVDLAGHFSDPDGDELSYAASSSDAEVATVSGDSVAVTGVASGSAEITVTASDGSLSASQDLTAFVRLTERQVLEILYGELGGDGWRNNANWKTDKPLDEWHGVSTNADGRVDTLTLRGNSLTGEIPSELGDLSSLEVLWVLSNSLTGEIPSELGDLSNLETLGLNHNSLTGEIPPELGDLSNLEWLYLESNSLTGEIPLDFLDLSSLEWFYWDDNEGLCAPDTTEFDNWLDGLSGWRGPRCD